MGLTKATYSMVKGGPIDVRSYGAVGDGVADDTAAVQAAIDAAIILNTGILVNGTCKITASLNIDHQVSSATENRWFYVSSHNGGGFYVDTAITLFDTTLDYSSAPQTSQIKFDNITFEVSSATTAAYVLSPGYLRTTFDGCAFHKIKLLVSTTLYTQSIYLDKCVARAWSGTFYKCSAVSYDLKVFHCLIEAPQASSNAFDIGYASGCAFTDNVIEGIDGYCIQYDSANTLTIQGNYFEGNTGPEVKENVVSPDFALAVSVIGNHFENSAVTKTYCVGWSALSYGCVAMGNGATGAASGTIYLHYLPTAGSEGIINIHDEGASSGTVTSNIEARVFFGDRQYPAKAGYIYGESFDADASSLHLGTYYNSSTLLDLLELSHLDRVNFNRVDYKPAFVNMKAEAGVRIGLSMKNISAANTATYMSFVNSSNAGAGSISQTAATTVSYTTSSDYRLKTDVLPMVDATERLKKLKPVNFKWIADDTRTDGFIAHEVDVIVPEAIVGEKDAIDSEGVPIYQGIDQSKIVPLLVATIQDLITRIEVLETPNI
jgi:hypothetical protein